jgi:hypothetical protein
LVKFPVLASEFPVPKCPNLVSDKDSRLGVLTALRRLAVRMKRLGTQDGGLLRDPYLFRQILRARVSQWQRDLVRSVPG